MYTERMCLTVNVDYLFMLKCVSMVVVLVNFTSFQVFSLTLFLLARFGALFFAFFSQDRLL